jgi:O-antigen ligase
MGAEGLIKDPHNYYIEVAYYTGVVGLALIVGFYVAMVDAMRRRTPGFREQHLIARYVVILMTLMLYFTLHGMFQVISYGGLFLAILSVMLTKKTPADTGRGPEGG